MNPHRIVIAGAGYAGISCALRLARRVPAGTSITLISATDRFIERIRLHQRAAGQNVGDWSLPALIRGTGIQLRVGQIDQLDDRPRADGPPRGMVQGIHLSQHDVGAQDGAHRHLGYSVGGRSHGGTIASVVELLTSAVS